MAAGRMWHWRWSKDGQAEASVGVDEMLVADAEMITGLSLDQTYELGRRSGEVRVQASDADGPQADADAVDPGVVHVAAQGDQSVLLTIGEHAPEVDAAVASERKAQTSLEASHHELRDAVEAEVRAEHAVNVQQERADAYNGSRFEDAESWLLFVVLGGIAIAEWVLNRVPFNLAGDDQLGTDLLAATVGVGLVAAAHLGGVGLKRALVPINGERRAAAHHQVMVGVLFALVLAVVAIGGMRATYFAQENIPVSWVWMMVVQTFLLSVATLLSMAHDAPMKAELSRLEEIHDDIKELVAVGRSRQKAAAEALHDAVARSRTVRTRAICEIRVQDVHTTRAWAEYAAGVQEAMGRPVGCERPASASMPRVAQWSGDLYDDTNPALPDIDELIRRWRAEAAAALEPTAAGDVPTSPHDDPADDDDAGAGHHDATTAGSTSGADDDLQLVDLDDDAMAGSPAPGSDGDPAGSHNGKVVSMSGMREQDS